MSQARSGEPRGSKRTSDGPAQLFAPPAPETLAEEAADGMRREMSVRRWILARNIALGAALSVQLGMLVHMLLVLLTLPIGIVCLLVAVGIDASLVSSGRALFPRLGALSPFLVLLVGGAAQTGVTYGLTLLGQFLGVEFRRGRQVRSGGKVLLAGIEGGTGWTPSPHAPRAAPRPVPHLDAAAVSAVPEALRGPLADKFRDNGLTEHASVAAFSKLSLDLLALGAPAALVTQAQEDALDEIRHAELCFGLAEALDGRKLQPGPIEVAVEASPGRSREQRLAALAVESLVDGALHEGLSARVLSRLGRGCEVEAIRALVLSLAADEGRHAAHAWDVVDHCVDAGGTFVVDAVRAVAAALPDEHAATLPAWAADGQAVPFGVHGAEMERAAYRETLAALRTRVAAYAAPARRAA